MLWDGWRSWNTLQWPETGAAATEAVRGEQCMEEVEWGVLKLSEVSRNCSLPSRSQVGANMKGWVLGSATCREGSQLCMD